MDNLTESGCCLSPANEPAALPSLPSGTRISYQLESVASQRRMLSTFCCALFVAALFAGCGNDTPPAQPAKPAAETKPALTVPEDIQDAADALLGKETTVLLTGDLAKNGKQQFLAANVIPKSTRNQLPGTIITREVVGQKENGKWAEIFRCDEHLKNAKGFLPGTPIGGISGWRLAYEEDPEKGMALYFTPLKGAVDTHSLPIGVRWNPKVNRYQSLDRSYEHFLNEAPSLSTARSSLR
jgi:hypothetical protein